MYLFPEVWKQLALFRIFLLKFLSNILFFNNGGGHVWWRFRSSTIILIGDHKCIISTKFGNNCTLPWIFRIFYWMFLLILPLCSTFSNGSHVGWSAGTSERIFKLDTMRMIVAKFGSVVSEQKIFFLVYRQTTTDAKSKWWQ